MPTETIPEFVHGSLPSSSCIRLLERQEPASDGTVRFRLFSYDPKSGDKLAYYCLSYTWGNPFAHGPQFRKHFDEVAPQYDHMKPMRILINDQPFPLQKNLHDALLTLPQDTFQEWVNSSAPETNGRTLLHLAAGRGNVERINNWLLCGADINKFDDGGNNALHYAAGNGKSKAIPVLKQYGCHAVANHAGQTPLDIALSSGYEDVVKELQTPQPRKDIPRAETKVFIWADALCINQNDIEEKGAQVTMMDQIYASASYVVAWLGLPDGQTETAIRTLDTLRTHLKAFKASVIEPFSGKDKDNYTQAGLPYISSDEWDSLASLYQRQWFRRAWIVQEALLPPSLLMYVGNQTVQWRSLATVAEAIRSQEAKLGTSTSTGYIPLKDIAVPVVWNIAELAKWRRYMTGARREDDRAEDHRAMFTPHNLAYNLITFLASDPRDTVFAYYGLLNLFADRKEANYRLSTPEVYTRATREIIASEQSLHVLAWCIHSAHRRNDLPSWVPDYSLAGANAIPPTISADKGLEYTPQSIIDLYSPVLHVKGVCIGSVSGVSNRTGTGKGEKVKFDRSWLTLPLSLRDQGGVKCVLSYMLWQTLCMSMSAGSMFDSNEFGSEAPDELGMEFRIFVLLLILAAADGMIREKVGAQDSMTGLIFSHIDYDPMKEDMEPVLADLDAFQEYDGPGCWLPTREEVLKYWNEFKYSLLRNSEVADDSGPADFYLPAGVTEDNSRAVGTGLVLLSSRLARNCRGFFSAYSTMYGGRKLITFGTTSLGLAPISAHEGDEIWLLPGLNAPAVLRQVPAHPEDGDDENEDDKPITRQFLGSCYLWGLMDGQLGPIVKDKMIDLALI